MTSEIDKLKHFHIKDYSGTNFTDDLNDGEEFLYTTIRCCLKGIRLEDVTVELEDKAYEEMRNNK